MLPEFLGSQTGEDPQKFIDEVKKMIEVIHVTGGDREELHLTNLKMWLISRILSENKIGVQINSYDKR